MHGSDEQIQWLVCIRAQYGVGAITSLCQCLRPGNKGGPLFHKSLWWSSDF